MWKYALRYAPLLILALLLIPLRIFMVGSVHQAGKALQYAAFPPYPASSSFNHYTAFYGVTMLSSGDTWAVGGSFSAKPDESRTARPLLPSSGMILHYASNTWVAANITQPLRVPLLSVSLDSPQDGWAVGLNGTFVHYNGNEWSIVPGPANFNRNLLGVIMLSASDGWAVGYSGSILHYNGKQWTQVPSPTTVDLRSIAMPSAQEGWAVGDSGTILRYHAGTWSIIRPSPTSSTLNRVSMLSTNEGWVVGRQGTVLHYRDGTWESVHPAAYYRSPSTYQSVELFDVVMNSIHSGWIAGGQHFLTYSSEAWIEQGNVVNSIKGQSPGMTLNSFNMYAIAMSPTGKGWAVGGLYSYKSDNEGVILHYQSGKWDISLIVG